MRIASSQVRTKSEHSLETASVSAQSLNVWSAGAQARQEEEPSVIVELDFANAHRQRQARESSGLSRMERAAQRDTDIDVRLRLLESIVFALTGRRLRLRASQPDIDGQGRANAGTQGAAQGGTPWGVEYRSFESYAEAESVSFQAEGTVTTADGRSLSFGLDFRMSRSYYEERSTSLSIGARPACDPLVVAFGGGAPALTQNKFAFDLDGDGSKENISFATGGSGFLALDKNGDGKINDGAELFGPQSGSGFTDLAAYDLDKNGWIDEGDPVFGKLSILSTDESGRQTLFSLGEAGIGAIYLNETKTEYTFGNSRQSSGAMRSSSVFLREDGTAGTIHHIDLTL